MEKSYYIPFSEYAEDRFVEKRSKFTGRLWHVETPEEATAKIKEMRETYWDATHHCYAYILREGNLMRYSDDGEPQGTAGMPILDVLRHENLVDVCCVVTRYFGGILLGTGGLVRAYTESASTALAAAQVVTVRACVRLSVEVDYALYERAVQLLQGAGARLDEPVFTDRVALSALLPAGAELPLLPAFAELSRGAAVPQVSDPFYAPL